MLTAFQVIDGASSLRVVGASGRAIDTKTVVAWNRRQDWAVLQVAGIEGPEFAIAKTDSWGVGDRCFYLDAAGPGNRVIVATSIVGKNTFPHAGDRISLGTSPANAGIGTALLDEYGDVIGVTGACWCREFQHWRACAPAFPRACCLLEDWRCQQWRRR